MLIIELDISLRRGEPDELLAADLRTRIGAAEEEIENYQAATLSEVSPAVEQPKDWSGWFLGDGLKAILSGVFWTLVMTFFSPIALSGPKKRVETPEWEQESGQPDPY